MYETRDHSGGSANSSNSGLNALAGINHAQAPLPEGASSLVNDRSNSHSPSPSRPASRNGSRSSSVNSQQYPDSLGIRGGLTSKMLKKQRSNTGMTGIAGALALSGVALASPSPQLRQPMGLAKQPDIKSRESEDSDVGYSRSAYGDDGLLHMDALGDFDDVVSQLGTGYAVASSKRNADFHGVFKAIPEDDYLIEDYGCALQREILIQGRIYISEHHLSFNANIFGWVTSHTLPFSEIISIEKRMTAYVIPNAIQVKTHHATHTFASFLSRDSTYDLICNIWKMAHPAAAPSLGEGEEGSVSGDASDMDDSVSVDSRGDETQESVAKRARGRLRGLRRRANTGASNTDKDGNLHPNVQPARPGATSTASHSGAAKSAAKAAHPVTTDTLATLKNLKEVCMDTVFPSAPEKIYNLMFTSGFMKDFWIENQKLLELQIGDWAPEKTGSNLLARSMSYIKPLNGSIGPKQTKCLITDESAHVDFDNFVCVITTTRTPDVPSGGSFSVKTRTSMTWARGNSCRVLVTTGVEWTKSSFIKGIIDRSAIDGQKTYHSQLEEAMRAYISQHRSEFLEEGQDAEQEAIKDAREEEEREELKASGAPAAGTSQAEQKEDKPPALKVVLDTLEGTFEAISDMFGGLSATSLALGGVIAILILSNLWTLSSRPASAGAVTTSRGGEKPARGANQQRHPDAVAEAVRDVLQDYFAVKPAGSSSPQQEVATDPGMEIEAIAAALDKLEARLVALRGALGEVSVDVERGEAQVAEGEALSEVD